jgi:hypothetical protein
VVVISFVQTTQTGWQRFKQYAFSYTKNPGKSKVVFLPMIDLCASDDSCVFSTLLFLAEQAILCMNSVLSLHLINLYTGRGHCLFRFLKTKKILLKLGGFHTIMNFAGCIGQITEGLGLEKLLNLVNATNTVPYMLSCKLFLE